jgi:hypothetical protein
MEWDDAAAVIRRNGPVTPLELPLADMSICVINIKVLMQASKHVSMHHIGNSGD